MCIELTAVFLQRTHQTLTFRVLTFNGVNPLWPH